jgi:hypothetical protein
MTRQTEAKDGAEQRFRDCVADVIEQRGYLPVSQERFEAARVLGQPIYSREFEAGPDLYGKPRRVDFILYHPSLHDDCLALRCRWQAASGSVDQKFPFEVESIKVSGIDTIIVLDGGGYTDQARDWLSDQVGKGGLVAVLDLAELARYADSGGI